MKGIRSVIRKRSERRVVVILAIAMLLVVISSNVSVLYLTIQETNSVPYSEDVLILQIGNSPEVASASEILVSNLGVYNEGLSAAMSDSFSNGISNSMLMGRISVTRSVIMVESKQLLTTRKATTDLDHLESVLIRNRATVLIIIGHGTPNGLIDESDTMSWNQLASEIQKTNTKIPVILACYSSAIQKYLPSAIGMDGELDASLGAIALSALVVSIYGGGSSDVAQFAGQLINRITILERYPDRFQPLANWAAVRSTVVQIIRSTPAPKTYWTDTAVALKILGMVVGTIMLILMDHLSSSSAKILGLIAGTIAAVSSLVGVIGQVTGLDQMFMVPVLWGTLNLWPVVKIAVGLLVCGFILAFGTPFIALMNLVVRNGAGILLYSLISYFASTTSYESLFVQIGRILGNFLSSLLLPIIVILFGLAGVYLNSYAQRIVKTCIYLLCVIVIYSAVDNLISRAASLFDVSKAISASLQKSLTLWNICCWIVDWSMWLT